MRLRFQAISELSEDRALLPASLRLDYLRPPMAFIAIDEDRGRQCLETRLHLDADCQGRRIRRGGWRSAPGRAGLGWLLMQRMIAYARRSDWKRARPKAAENTTMLHAEPGFHISDCRSRIEGNSCHAHARQDTAEASRA